MLITVSTTTYASNNCWNDDKLNGVNLAGAEFNTGAIPGVLWKNFVFPTTSQLEYYRDKGIKSIRLPITWNRMQSEPFANLEKNYLAEVKKIADFSEKNGICLIIDLHNYGKFKGQPLTSYANYDTIFTDFWLKISKEFKQDSVAFGLMNEPAYIALSTWRDLAQNTINTLRNNRVSNVILVSGGGWSGAHSWFSGMPSNAKLFSNLTDPMNRLYIEMHQYADSNYSGTKSDCISSDKMLLILKSVTNWADENRKRLWLGEFGFASTPECLNTMTAMVDFMNSSKVWAGWSYWAGGAWWGNYPFSIEPSAGVDKPQMTILQKKF